MYACGWSDDWLVFRDAVGRTRRSVLPDSFVSTDILMFPSPAREVTVTWAPATGSAPSAVLTSTTRYPTAVAGRNIGSIIGSFLIVFTLFYAN